MKKEKISGIFSIRRNRKKIIKERIHPRIWQWDYMVLKSILNEIKIFSESARKENARNVLDLGCGVKPYNSLFFFVEKYIGVDVSIESDADVIAYNWKLPFKENEFDVIICTQALEHTEKIYETISEIKRVLRPNGLVFVSAPLTFPEHGMPYDYYRFTRYGLEALFKDFEIYNIIGSNGYISTIFRLINILLSYFPLSCIIFSPLFIISNILGILFDKLAYYSFKILKMISGKKIFIKFYESYYLGLPENYILIGRNKKIINV